MCKNQRVETLGDLERVVAELRKQLPASTPLYRQIIGRGDKAGNASGANIGVAQWIDSKGFFCFEKPKPRPTNPERLANLVVYIDA